MSAAPEQFSARGRRSAPQWQATPASIEESVPTDYLGLPGLRTLKPIEESEFSIWVKAEQFPKLTSCPACGCADEMRFLRNGTRPQIVRHEPRGLRCVYIEVQR